MHPKVSVIIPVLNDGEQLRLALKALSEQTYPQNQIEIIVVDNGSDVSLDQIISEFDIIFLKETQTTSPYAARNRGLEIASGSIIALTDANKTPEKYWLEEGVKTLISTNSDLVGGNITYNLPENYTASHLFDSIYFNNNRDMVLNNGSSVTGNLFFNKELLETVGYFPEQFRSGMDIWWSQHAVRKGYKLSFSEKGIVSCNPRSFKELIKKSSRVGKTHPYIFKESGHTNLQVIIKIFRTFTPPQFSWISEKGLMNESFWFRTKIWFVAWSYKLFLGYGRIIGLKYILK